MSDTEELRARVDALEARLTWLTWLTPAAGLAAVLLVVTVLPWTRSTSGEPRAHTLWQAAVEDGGALAVLLLVLALVAVSVAVFGRREHSRVAHVYVLCLGIVVAGALLKADYGPLPGALEAAEGKWIGLAGVLGLGTLHLWRAIVPVPEASR